MQYILIILNFILGAGKGIIGTAIRTILAVLSGWLLSKGIDIDAGTLASLQDAIVGFVLTLLAGIGSVLNNKANQKEPEAPVKDAG